MRVVTNILGDSLVWLLPNSISSDILELLITESKKAYINNRIAFSDVTLDFSKIKFIDIEGAMSIICFCSAIKRKNTNTVFHYIYPTEKVFDYLINLGFFLQLNNKVGFLERQDIIRYENDKKSTRRLNQKKNYINQSSRPIILPIETVIQKNKNYNVGMTFENKIGAFAKHALATFDNLKTIPEYKFNGEDYYQFCESNLELYKNIFQHSESWGIAAIHANPKVGTSVCYYDIGIGFKASINRFETELESLKWALIEGNTSKPDSDNDGFGFTLVQDFVFKRNGYIKIRSGDCKLELKPGPSIVIEDVSYFPGVQISFYIPI